MRVIGIDDRLTGPERRRHAEAALALIAAGEIRPLVGQVIPLERASEAHAAIEGRGVAGKTLLATGPHTKKAG